MCIKALGSSSSGILNTHTRDASVRRCCRRRHRLRSFIVHCAQQCVCAYDGHSIILHTFAHPRKRVCARAPSLLRPNGGWLAALCALGAETGSSISTQQHQQTSTNVRQCSGCVSPPAEFEHELLFGATGGGCRFCCSSRWVALAS